MLKTLKQRVLKTLGFWLEINNVEGYVTFRFLITRQFLNCFHNFRKLTHRYLKSLITYIQTHTFLFIIYIILSNYYLTIYSSLCLHLQTNTNILNIVV